MTHRLETALTLRNYLQKQVHKLVEGVTTAEIARTVLGIWPEEVGVLLRKCTQKIEGKFSIKKMLLPYKGNKIHMHANCVFQNA